MLRRRIQSIDFFEGKRFLFLFPKKNLDNNNVGTDLLDGSTQLADVDGPGCHG